MDVDYDDFYEATAPPLRPPRHLVEVEAEVIDGHAHQNESHMEEEEQRRGSNGFYAKPQPPQSAKTARSYSGGRGSSATPPPTRYRKDSKARLIFSQRGLTPFISDPFAIDSGGKAYSPGRRTSYALGMGHNHKTHQTSTQARFFRNREKLQFMLNQRLQEDGGLERVYKEMDQDGSETVTFGEFTKWLDSQGLSILHQDGRALLRSIDTNGDGVLQFEELKQFLEGDHAEAMQNDTTAGDNDYFKQLALQSARTTTAQPSPTEPTKPKSYTAQAWAQKNVCNLFRASSMSPIVFDPTLLL